MSAPNRAAQVQAIVSQHPETFQGPEETVDERKLALMPFIIRGLNAVDAGNWGLLVKTDQGNKIPADIAVWRPTMEHFDVLTDNGATWAPKGVVSNPAWLWKEVPGAVVTPPHPTEPPAPTSPVLLEQFQEDVRQSLGRVEKALAALLQKPDPVVSVPPVAFPNYTVKADVVLPTFLGGKREFHALMEPEKK